MRPYLKNTRYKTGLEERLKCLPSKREAWSSKPSIIEKGVCVRVSSKPNPEDTKKNNFKSLEKIHKFVYMEKYNKIGRST
jgi:hypothetical protein